MQLSKPVHSGKRINGCIKQTFQPFFDNVDREKLIEKIKSFIKHRSLHKLLFLAVSREVQTTSLAQEKELKNLVFKEALVFDKVCRYLHFLLIYF
jgi:hypothetical protein